MLLLPFILALFYFFNQLMTVADCASRLRLLSKALDLNVLRLDDPACSVKQKLVRLHVVGLGLDVKESLLEACGLVLLANSHLDPHLSGEQKKREKKLPICHFYLLNIVQRRLCEE